MTLTELQQQNLAPQWMNEEALALCTNYMTETESSPADLYQRLASTASKYLGEEFKTPIYEALFNGWLSPATPVAVNFGAYYSDNGVTKPRGLPISCYGLYAKNSIDGIFETATEAAVLSKNGGGLGIDVSGLRGRTLVSQWARLYDLTAELVSQGGVRRGSVALYCSIEHPDIMSFLHSKDMLEGDPRQTLNCNIAVTVPDSFFHNWNEEKAKVWAKVLDLRMKQGSPYLFFIDAANRHKGQDYEALNLDIKASQLCSEITLHSSEDYTYVCTLSSLVVSRYDEWKDHTWEINNQTWHLPDLSIAFLDAVVEEFIGRATSEAYKKGKDYLTKAVNFTKKSRALGLGLVGWASYLQSKRIPFECLQAKTLNKAIMTEIESGARLGSRRLAKLLGIPGWCRTSKMRHTHLIAIAPTLGNCVLSNAGSHGVEPLVSNYYTYIGANGVYIRKNSNLERVLKEIGLDTPDIWKSIEVNEGSIQHLEKEIRRKAPSSADRILQTFKTAYEIDQFAILHQAADRQKIMDSHGFGQGQSINLFIKYDTDAQTISDLHIEAWKLGLKSLYYVRSNAPGLKELRNLPTTLEEDKVPNWSIQTKEGCSYCDKALSLFRQIGITPLVTETAEDAISEGYTYPRIWRDDVFIGGYLELAHYFNIEEVKENTPAFAQVDCAGCDG